MHPRAGLRQARGAQRRTAASESRVDFKRRWLSSSSGPRGRGGGGGGTGAAAMRGVRPVDAPGTGRGADLGGETGPPAGLRRIGVLAPGEDLPRGSGGRRVPPGGGRGGAMTLLRAASCLYDSEYAPATHVRGHLCASLSQVQIMLSLTKSGRRGVCKGWWDVHVCRGG